MGLVDESYFNTNENNNGTARMIDLEQDDNQEEEVEAYSSEAEVREPQVGGPTVGGSKRRRRNNRV